MSGAIVSRLRITTAFVYATSLGLVILRSRYRVGGDRAGLAVHGAAAVVPAAVALNARLRVAVRAGCARRRRGRHPDRGGAHSRAARATVRVAGRGAATRR